MAGFTDPETYAINYLRSYWWNETPMSVLGFTTYQAALDHYRSKSPTFLVKLSESLKSVSQDRVKRAFNKVAAQYGTQYPPTTAFFNELALEAGSLTSSDYKEVAKATVEKVGSVAEFGLKGAAVVLIVVGVGLALFYAQPLLKARAS